MKMYICMDKERFILVEYINDHFKIIERKYNGLLNSLLPNGSDDERIREFLWSRVNRHFVEPGGLMRALRLTHGEKFTDSVSLEFIDDEKGGEN